jgi:hypothetical protein
VWNVRRAYAVAVGDRGEPLNVGSENICQGSCFGLAQLWELSRHMGDRTMVLADLQTLTNGFNVGRVTLIGQRRSDGSNSVEVRSVALLGVGELGVDSLGQGAGSVLGERDNSRLASGRTQISQGGRCKVVIGMSEARTAGVGQRVGPCRTSAAPGAQCCCPRLDFTQHAVADQAIEMPPNRGGGKVKLPSKACRSQRARLVN